MTPEEVTRRLKALLHDCKVEDKPGRTYYAVNVEFGPDPESALVTVGLAHKTHENITLVFHSGVVLDPGSKLFLTKL